MDKRLLFVDDEDILREFYLSLDSALGEGHEICTAPSGAEALRLMQEKPFDVIISDLAMPNMDGLQFLGEVVRTYPESARIVISGFADRLKVAECLTVGHRFFNKPFNVKAFSALLKRICQYSYLISSEKVRRIVCGSKALPTPPDTYLRLNDVLNSEYCDLEEVGRIVQQDAGLSTKLLHIVNSAQFGFARQIASPVEAVQLLGVEVLRSLMLGAQVFNFYEGQPSVRATFNDLWSHSLKTAIAARKLAVSEGLPTPVCEECFLAGLLHDIGKLILAANSPVEYKLVMELVNERSLPLDQAEMGIFESTHAQIGAYLLALWGVSDRVISAVELHHSIGQADLKEFYPVLAVHVAQNLAPGANRESRLDHAALERAGLLDRIPEWQNVLESDC